MDIILSLVYTAVSALVKVTVKAAACYLFKRHKDGTALTSDKDGSGKSFK